MKYRLDRVAGDLVLVILVTPPVFYCSAVLVDLILSVAPLSDPSTNPLWLAIAELAWYALSGAITCFITARVGKTFLVAVVSPFAVLAFLAYLSSSAPPTRHAERTLQPKLVLLAFAAGGAGTYIGYGMAVRALAGSTGGKSPGGLA